MFRCWLALDFCGVQDTARATSKCILPRDSGIMASLLIIMSTNLSYDDHQHALSAAYAAS